MTLTNRVEKQAADPKGGLSLAELRAFVEESAQIAGQGRVRVVTGWGSQVKSISVEGVVPGPLRAFRPADPLPE